jgi:pentatricopeptide repeat protein
MVGHNVVPDMAMFNKVVEVVADQALSVAAEIAKLNALRQRYGGVFGSTESRVSSLAKDDSMTVAKRLFEEAIQTHPNMPLSEQSYRVLIAACAEHALFDDMGNVWAHMDGFGVAPHADTFIRMIPALAKMDDMATAVQMYNEYKRLAVADNHSGKMLRKDDEVYAALVEAYTIRGQDEATQRFQEQLRHNVGPRYPTLANQIGLESLLPVWLGNGLFEKAHCYVRDNITGPYRDAGFANVCIKAADNNDAAIAVEAFNGISAAADISEPAHALSAMYFRNCNPQAADEMRAMSAKPDTLEMVAMRSIALMLSGYALPAFQEARALFAHMRATGNQDTYTRINEVVDAVERRMIATNVVLPLQASIELFWLMIEHTGPRPIASLALANFGPEQLMSLPWNDLQVVAHTQALVITSGSTFDIASEVRLASIVDMLLKYGEPAPPVADAIDKAFHKLNEFMQLNHPEILARWAGRHYEPVYSPAFASFPATPMPAPFEETHDPYAATTDAKGSIVITDALERTHGKFSVHLNDALNRFHHIRKAGRHPRFFAYARLISGAAKDGRLPLAREILDAARTDVPYLPNNRVVHHGWVGILDAMVAACLNTGERRAAEQFHAELRAMGAAPSANTFGLYITTLKESSAKTFDEASEAVRIFARAREEGVEPSSFLYNALIGKLGKARRIDDCLLHFSEMRALGIKPTSVTYGTIVNALCRVSDEKFAEELFDEMEAMPNYKPRPAPYHSMMQFFLTTKRDRAKVLAYHARMRARGVAPTPHTHKLLIDAHATLDPPDMAAAEAQLARMRGEGVEPEAVHYAALLHAKGCAARDWEGARAAFDAAVRDGGAAVARQPCLYQALLESAAACGRMEAEAQAVLDGMRARGVPVTAYVANALIAGWAGEGRVDRARSAYDALAVGRREPSTYEAMTRALVLAERVEEAREVVREACGRGYPAAVAGKIADLVGGRGGA